MSEWPKIRLEELAADEKSAISKPYGSAFMKKDYLSKGIPVVRGVNLARGLFHDDDFVYISPDLADKMPGATLLAGDLVVTHRGTIGQVSMIPRSPRYSRYVASTSHVKVRLKFERAIPEFYYYWFRSEEGQHELLSNASTVGVPGIGQPVATIKSLRVPHPPIKIQRVIAGVLGALDDKIAINERIALTGFDLIQETWRAATRNATRVVTFSELASLDKGISYKGSGLGSGEQLVNLANFSMDGRFRPEKLKRYSGPAKEKHFVRNGDLVIANTDLTQRREVLGRPAIIQMNSSRALFSHHVFAVRPFEGCEDDLLWIYGALCDPAFRDRAASYASGTTVVALPRDAILAYALPFPSAHERRDWTDKSSSLLNIISARTRENRALAGLRDALLPKLMSGEIRVRDAEQAVKEAV
jgi:type I restriction enzyme S subunit